MVSGEPAQIEAIADAKLHGIATNPELYDTPGAAAFIGVKPGTLEVWRALKRPQPRYLKIGRLVRYRRQDLLDWLDARAVSCVAVEV
jgi:hypothetical protein